MVGTPLSDLAVALGESATSEIVLAHSAARLLGTVQSSGWTQRTLPTGITVLRPELHHDILVKATPQLTTAASKRGPRASRPLCSQEEVVNRMQQEERSRSASCSSIRLAEANNSHRRDSPLSLVRDASMFGSRTAIEAEDDMGLGPLLRFMPGFVHSQLLAGYNPSSLMEHRMVTILFVIADMEVSSLACSCHPARPFHLVNVSHS